MRAAADDTSTEEQILSSEDQVQNSHSEESSQIDDLGSSSGSCEEDKPEGGGKSGDGQFVDRKKKRRMRCDRRGEEREREQEQVREEIEDEDEDEKEPQEENGDEELDERGAKSTQSEDHQHHHQKSQQFEYEDHLQQHQQQQHHQAQQGESFGKPVLKKPDKLVPCPRCNSMDTKFCYFNNYNVNQPRHFCKNCQRYWTAGGTLRNVPVGAGRRKSKHSGAAAHTAAWNSATHANHFHHHQHQHHSHQQQQDHHSQQRKQSQQQQQPKNDAPPFSQQRPAAARLRLPAAVPQEICAAEASPSGSSSILTSLNSPGHGSINSILNIHLAAAAAAAAAAASAASPDATSPAGNSASVSSSFRRINSWVDSSTDAEGAKENSKDHENATGNGGGAPPPPPPFGLFNNLGSPPLPPTTSPMSWPCFPWSGGFGAPFAEGGGGEAEMASWLGGVWAANFPAWAPFAAALWGPAAPPPPHSSSAASPPMGWNVPWAAAAAAAFAAAAAAAAANTTATSSPYSLPKVLGKHSREGSGRGDGSLWAPKTLRIDDPGAAAKSSIWATLGIEKAAPATGRCGGLDVPAAEGVVFKSFHSKGKEEKAGKVHANPAALCRSLSFQERN